MHIWKVVHLFRRFVSIRHIFFYKTDVQTESDKIWFEVFININFFGLLDFQNKTKKPNKREIKETFQSHRHELIQITISKSLARPNAVGGLVGKNSNQKVEVSQQNNKRTNWFQVRLQSKAVINLRERVRKTAKRRKKEQQRSKDLGTRRKSCACMWIRPLNWIVFKHSSFKQDFHCINSRSFSQSASHRFVFFTYSPWNCC